jgi:tRNA uridine 5-carboxymethylaminomethyl modification enzyme
MFTSRAEHRLLLREDNADLRLTPLGRSLGLIDDARWQLFEAKQAACEAELTRLAAHRVRASDLPPQWSLRVLGGPLRSDVSGLELLRRPGVSHAALLEVAGPPAWADLALDERLPPQLTVQLEVQARYAGYIERQQQEIERTRRQEETALPADLDYSHLGGLSHEVRQRLAEARPATLGQAARIPGVTPAAVSILLVHLKRHGGGPKKVA